MGKKSNLKKIFSSYSNNVMLKEAVKPTEEGGTFDPAKAAQKKQELLRQRGAEVASQANQQQATAQPTNSGVTTNKTSPIVGRADPSTQQGQTAIAQNQQQIQQKAQDQNQARANQNAASAASLQNLQSGGRVQPQQDNQQSQNNNSEEIETSTIQQQTVTQEPLVMDDSGESVTADEIQQMIKNLNVQAVPASDEEMSEDEETDLSKIQEKRNISKFLKFLSEKNYSMANNYLNAIVESKFNKKIKKFIK